MMRGNKAPGKGMQQFSILLNDQVNDEDVCNDNVSFPDYLIVDVRDEDRAVGHIKDSHNLPSEVFQSGVDDLIKDTANVPVVIFHCMMSTQRGPIAAQIYRDRRNVKAENEDQKQQVLILEKGFKGFAEAYQDDPLLVENLDESLRSQ
ncbi:Rhodanese-like protein [Phlebopus sp. FC_14]|nr:Rhodanese-like protein [Phlebopus sp. FC_14]